MKKEKNMKKIEHYCGECCWEFGEDCDGCASCAKRYLEEGMITVMCDQEACGKFISREELDERVEDLKKFREMLHDGGKSCMPENDGELRRALDFVLDYIKTYDEVL